MKMQNLSRVRLILCSAMAVFLCGSGSWAAGNTEYTVSIRNLKIPAGESVVGFEIDLAAGAFTGVSNLPVGWSFTLDNDASWQTKIVANATVGSASMDVAALESLRFRVRKNEFGDLKFDVSGMAISTRDYGQETKNPLTMGEFSVSPAG